MNEEQYASAMLCLCVKEGRIRNGRPIEMFKDYTSMAEDRKESILLSIQSGMTNREIRNKFGAGFDTITKFRKEMAQ